MSDRTTLGFDKIYILNLPRRPDRQRLVKNELHLNGIVEYEFIKNMVDAKNLTLKWLLDEQIISPIQVEPGGTITIGVFGCALSHFNAWTELVNSDHENALILEDDIYLGNPDIGNADRVYDIITNELSTIKDWDIFFLSRLSGFNKNVGKTITKNIIKPISSWQMPDPKPWGGHAYAINRKAAEFMINDYFPIWTPIDIYLDMFTLTKDLNVYSTLDNYLYQRNQWLMLKQEMVTRKALDESEFGTYNDSNIVSNKPNDGGFTSLRCTWKNLEAAATINMNDKIVTFITEESFNDFLRNANSINDVYSLFREVRLAHEGGPEDAKIKKLSKQKLKIEKKLRKLGTF